MIKKRQHLIMVAVFAVVIVFLLGALLVLPTRARSDLENRNLAQIPSVPSGIHGIKDYARSWDTFFVDQVPFRNSWLKLHSFAEIRVLGKVQMNNVVVGKDGYLLRVPDLPARTKAELNKKVAAATKQVAAVNDLVTGYGGRLLYVIAPDKPSFMRKDFPAYLPYPAMRDQTAESFLASLNERDIETLDLTPALQEGADKQLFYRTDHHWTFDGAYLGYSAIMQVLGFPPLQSSDLKYTTLPNSFVGSDNRTIGMAIRSRDRFSIGVPRQPVPCTVMLGAGDTSQGRTLFDLPPDATSPVSYEGVYPLRSSAEVIIDTHRPDLPDALIVGDSFKGPVECLLYEAFDQTRTLDLRRDQKMSVLEYVKEHKPAYVIFLLSGTFYLQSPWTKLGG